MEEEINLEQTEESNSTAEIPTSSPKNIYQGPQENYLFGRKVIYADYTEDQMDAKTIAKILDDVFSIHLQNASEIDYLEKYYKGYQPILSKTKDVRPNINNITYCWHNRSPNE